jgi:type II secretory pathway pseudopilin PulG
MRDDETGFALLMVLVIMALLTALVVTSITLATNNIRPSRRAQDSQAAIAAAQTAIDDYTSGLNHCDSLWTGRSLPPRPSECADRYQPANVAHNGGSWAPVPGGDGSTVAEYRYQVLLTPLTNANLIRIRADGRVNGVERSVVVDFVKAGFLQFIYYTDKESSDPDGLRRRSAPRTVSLDAAGSLARFGRDDVREIAYAGITTDEANKCAPYWYAAPGVAGRATRGYAVEYGTVTFADLSTRGWGFNLGCEIQFTGGDVIDGPLYSNDALLLNTRNGADPWFKGPVHTGWQLPFAPAPRADRPWRENGAGSKPDVRGYEPEFALRNLSLPPSNADIRKETVGAGRAGCLYLGATSITFLDNGRLEVTSPGTTAPSHGYCGSGTMSGPQVIDGPTNGVIYVDPLPATFTCPAKTLGKYPQDGDISNFDCRAGDAYVEGRVNGKFTVATKDRILVTEDLEYAGGTARDSDDVLGLAASEGNVEIYHPVGCVSGAPTATSTCLNEAYKNLSTELDEITVHAAILSVNHSFTVQNYDKGAKLGNLSVVGGIYQRYRGAVGTGGSINSGYLKNYAYDKRLISLPPPYFLKPDEDPWLVTGFSEN